MEFISELPIVGGFLTTILAFIVMIGIVVFVHEYGHYIVGRWCGIHAETFSIGFGKVLKSWTDKRGTTWQVAALPLGGYVKFLGDADGSSRADPDTLADMDAATRARSFHGAAVWKRMLTVAAGPVANFLLTIAIVAGLAIYVGIPQDSAKIGRLVQVEGLAQPLQSGDTVVEVNGQKVSTFGEIIEAADSVEGQGAIPFLVERDGERLELLAPHPYPPLISDVQPYTPAARAGIKRGDYIVSVDGQPVAAFRALPDIVQAAEGTSLILEILRDGERLSMPITPERREILNNDGEVEHRVLIGIGSGPVVFPETLRPGPIAALGHGVEGVGSVISQSLNGIRLMVTGALSPTNLSGPVGIAHMSGHQFKQDFVRFIEFIAIVSTAIGLLNLFPIPVLDGGHLVMHAYEALAGRPPAEKIQHIAMTIGLAMVLLLMVFATYNDVMRLVVS